jgi:hypothetical protein
MKGTGTLPGFKVAPILGESQDVDNLQLAAIIYALDVPLQKQNGWTVQAGQGIKGNRLTFHFHQPDPAGYKPKQIADWYSDAEFQAKNPIHPVSVCVKAFEWWREFSLIAKREKSCSFFNGSSDTVRITNTRKAAAIAAMKHPMMGIRWSGPCCIFHFPAVASVDEMLYEREIYSELPKHNLAYAKAALMSHEEMLKLAGNVSFARVEHRGKIAIIGKDVNQRGIDTLDKLLHKKKPI